MVDIVNAAPMVVDLGARGLDSRILNNAPLEIPQHIPKFYIFAERGPVGSYYVDFSQYNFLQLYGDNTFDINGKYYTHQTLFAQGAAAEGNNCVIHRLLPTDATDVSNVALYLDVLPVNVPVYQKNSDGSLLLDGNGDPLPVLDSNSDPVTTPGYKVAWVASSVTEDYGDYTPGILTARPGLQNEGSVQSTQYPIFEFSALYPGEAGNKLCVKIYPALKTDLVPFPDYILNEGKLFPLYFQLGEVSDPLTGKIAPVINNFGSQYVRFVPKENGIDPSSGAIIDLRKVVIENGSYTPYGETTGLGNVHVYNDNLNLLTEQFYNAEKVVVDVNRDSVIDPDETNYGAINVISFTSSNGSPYQAIKLVDITGSVRLTRNTNVFLAGGSDGTMSDAIFNQLVSDDLDKYNNNLDEYNDIVLHPESIIYDSGFSLETKKDLLKFISRRKDTFVALGTYAENAPVSTIQDHYAIGVALKTIAELYPESAYFGTGVMRAIVVAGSGKLINSIYNKRVPVTYEVLRKASAYMGAANGAWKNGFCFDKAPLSVVNYLKDIDVTWVPAATRNVLWGAGINFVLNYKVRRQFFPAIQTVYENDTSTLNSFFTAVAISYLNKVGHAAWREFSGSISLTNAQLVERVNAFVAETVKDKFDNKFVIVPNCTVTEYDALRGYSFTLDIKIYSPNMKTVMVNYVTAYRIEDLAVA